MLACRSFRIVFILQICLTSGRPHLHVQNTTGFTTWWWRIKEDGNGWGKGAQVLLFKAKIALALFVARSPCLLDTTICANYYKTTKTFQHFWKAKKKIRQLFHRIHLVIFRFCWQNGKSSSGGLPRARSSRGFWHEHERQHGVGWRGLWRRRHSSGDNSWQWVPCLRVIFIHNFTNIIADCLSWCVIILNIGISISISMMTIREVTLKTRLHYGGITCYSCRAFFRWVNSSYVS